jgi:hypothetical protein
MCDTPYLKNSDFIASPPVYLIDLIILEQIALSTHVPVKTTSVLSRKIDIVIYKFQFRILVTVQSISLFVVSS